MFAHDILFRKEELIRSKNFIVSLLSNKYYKQKAKFCLIRQQYLNKYENYILNHDKNSDNKDTKFGSDIKDSIDFEYKDLLNKLNDPNIKINELPKIFPLNESNYNYFKKNTTPKEIKNNSIDNNINNQNIELINGIFAQGLLEIRINKLFYLFFFEDNGFLRQGFLQIKDDEFSTLAIDEIKTTGPRNFIKYTNGKDIDDKELDVENESINLHILSKFDINIEKIRNEFNKINEEKNLKSMKLTDKNRSSSLNIDEFVKNMEEKIEKNVSNINSIFESVIPLDKEGKKAGNYKKNFGKALSFKKNDQKKEEELNKNPENQEDQKEDSANENPPELPTGLVGLNNIGATCYMNATVQSFSSVGLLVNELINPEFYEKLEKNKESKMRLTFALAEVFKNLWDNLDDKKAYSPYYFKDVISNMNPLFKGIAANDSKDLVLFLLETMHKELNTIDPKTIVDNNFVANQHIIEEVYKDFSNSYLSKNKSIIFDIFYGCFTSVNSCMYCRSQIYNIQVNNLGIFPLEEVRKFKNKNQETPVTIYDCFDYYQRHDINVGYYCDNCKNFNSTMISFNKYLYTPKVFIINFNYGKGIQFKVKFKFDEFIEIKSYVTAKDSPHNYELIAVICHYGESGMGGHFIAFGKRLVNYEYKWYKFNDGMVTESNFNEVQTSGMPTVLFYSYIIN